MLDLLWLVPALPFAGFLTLALAGARLSRTSVARIGVASIGLSALLTGLLGYLLGLTPASSHTQTLWTWLSASRFEATLALRFDGLSALMCAVVTGVGFLIHLYSAAYMAEDPDYPRFFAYLNLFVGFMLVLVLADDLLLLYAGWEGVGLCSYLLIGFWYREPANCRAAMKAFIVTRVGDAAMAIGLFLLATHFGTLRISELTLYAPHVWKVGGTFAVAAAALLLAGALGKSAQLPLQVWLPDAMAGPTPVSALIHAATMVTAGVYLIARTQVLFSLAPQVMLIVAVIGTATMLLAGLSALAQRDLKRLLAYSTISQLGFMFLALGVGAWGAAIFHLVTHAFFKALLFLCAGVIIKALHDEHDIFAMGGLRKRMPLVVNTFTIGAASLAGLPLVTAGFYSKDAVLHAAWASEPYGPWFLIAGLAGALITAIYAFRAVFAVFLGAEQGGPIAKPPQAVVLPLMVLACLAVVGGYLELPPQLGGFSLLRVQLAGALPAPVEHVAPAWLLPVAAAVPLLGVLAAWLLYVRHRQAIEAVAQSSTWVAVRNFALEGFGFDRLYDMMLAQPFVYLARSNARDVVDWFFGGFAELVRLLHVAVSAAQTGRVGWYAAGLAVAALLLLGLVVLR
jgi:NADH-quinone oxidoreductase subunit L